jgi:stress-induced morphogen
MASRTHQKDIVVDAIRDKLQKEYCAKHKKAKLKVYRYNSVSVRVRIVDPDFKGMSRVDRDSALWDVLDALPEDVRSDVSLLLLLTPEETKNSIMNLEFDDPTPSRL